MRMLVRIGSAAAVAMAAALAAAPASTALASTAKAHPRFEPGARDVVFVQTDNPAGNAVVAYDRDAFTGTLTAAGTYATGGTGGQLTGSVVDHLASQGSVAYDERSRLLLAVNAGSNTVSVFRVFGDRLSLRQVVGSGGTFPVSVAVHGNLVYVLNALNGGSVQGFVALFGHLFPLPRSNRALGLDPSATPQFTHTPGQVAFSPDGRQLVVTTKANGANIDVFSVGPFGGLSASPVVNPDPTPAAVPFAITFDQAGHLVVAETGTNSLATFNLLPSGGISLISDVGSTQAATCWVAPAGSYLFTSNAGSATVSGYQSSAAGQLTLVGQTPTDPGTVDASASADGQFLYVQTGAQGNIDEFQVQGNGTLAQVGSVAVPNAAGSEGISAF